MPLKERITTVDDLRSWKDEIPLHYIYTAGVAGEKFLRGLQEGKLLAAKCEKCGRMYLPPKMYCVQCFAEISKFIEIGPQGTVRAVAESYVDFHGNKVAKPVTFVFIEFRGVTGGLLHHAREGLKVGSKVTARFRPIVERKGSILDIEGFH